MAIIQYIYPDGTHLCSFALNQGWGWHNAANDWGDDVTTNTDCVPYCSDLAGALDETQYAVGRSRSNDGAGFNYGQFEWYGTEPPQACVITKVQIWAYARTSFGNAQTINTQPTIEGFVSDGATRYYYGSAVEVSRFIFRNRVDATGTFDKLDCGTWDVCPWTSAAWTQADLAAGTFKFGLASDGTHGSGIDRTDGGSSASLDIAQVYLELTTVPLDTVEPVRNVISTLLRLFRRPLRTFSMRLPPQFGDVSPGDTVWSSHSLLPVTSDGEMGLKSWQQLPLYILDVKDELDPPGIELKCLDLRQVWVNWWSPLRTTVGVTDDYRGIAKVDRGGGWETVRDQVAYVQRPGDFRFQQVAEDRAPIGKDGLLIEGGGDVNQLLNSSFSLGTTAITHWATTTVGAGTATASTSDYLIDSAGYRRAVNLATIAASDQAYLSQTTTSIGTSDSFHVHAWYKNTLGLADLSVQIIRNSDGYYWNDYLQAWSTGSYSARPTSADSWTRWSSNTINIGSASTVTVRCGLIDVDSTGSNAALLGSVELFTAEKAFASRRGLLPTQHSPLTRVANATYINNTPDYLVWNPLGPGWCKLTFTPNWSHADLADGVYKMLLDTIAGGEAWLDYSRIDATTARWNFGISNGVDTVWYTYFEATNDTTLAQAGRAVRIACRWTSQTQDEFDLVGQSIHIYVDGNDPTVAETGVVPSPTIDPDNSYILIGGLSLDDGPDGVLTDFEIGSHPRTAIELKARTGTITTHSYLEETKDLVVTGTATAERFPPSYVIVVVTKDVVVSGTATISNIPRLRTYTVITDDLSCGGTASASFVSA